MKFKDKKHIFLDLDHTLWDFDLNSKLAYKQIFEERNIDLSLDQFIEIYEPLNLEFWRKFRNGELTKEELRFQRLDTAFRKCNVVFEPSSIDHIANDYLQYLPEYNHLFDGCIELLDKLKPHYQLHLITNGFIEVQQRKVDASNLTPYFNVILTAEAAGSKKPEAAIFNQAMTMAGATPDQSLMIGDSLEADIQGAAAIGMDTIWLRRTTEPIPAGQHAVYDLLELLPFFGL